MSNGYKFIGGISKDFDSNKNLETYFGFGYENCCLAFKLYTSDKRLSKYNLIDFHALQPHDADWNKMIEIENKSRINWYAKYLLTYTLTLLLGPINAEILNNKVPTPKKVPVTFEAHGVTRVDNYYWMRDDTREDEEVISHLESENKYIESWFNSGEDLRDELFEEITDRIPKKEDSVPIRLKSYEYFRRYEPGNEHGIYIRRKNKNAKEIVLIDVNELAKDSEFYQLANWSISPKEDLMAYAEDTTGRREYKIKFKDLNTGQTYKNTLSNCSGDMAWSSDGRYLFYVLRDQETLLPFKLFRHEIGSSQSEDVLVYEEKDPTFYLSVGNSRSMQFIEINISSTTSSEVRLINSDTPEESPYIFLKRESDHLYSIEHDPEDNRFLVETNWLAKNFRLMTIDLEKSTIFDNSLLLSHTGFCPLDTFHSIFKKSTYS